jgi:hypothetical protein
MTKLLTALAILTVLTTTASAGSYDCVTRKSGSTTITTCGSGSSYSRCSGYWSGSVYKSSCR